LSGAALAKQVTGYMATAGFGVDAVSATAESAPFTSAEEAQWDRDELPQFAKLIATGNVSAEGHLLYKLDDPYSEPSVDEKNKWAQGPRKKWVDQNSTSAKSSESIFDSGCSVSKNFDSLRYKTLACVLQANPTFANNVLEFLLLDQFSKPQPLPDWFVTLQAQGKVSRNIRPHGTTLVEYDQAMSDSGTLRMDAIRGNLPMVYLKGKRSGWFLHLRKYTGEHWYWRLPDTVALATGAVYYPVSTSMLRDAQDLLLSRLTDYAATCSQVLTQYPEVLTRTAIMAPTRKVIPQGE
jgi:hypothetical protein